MEKILFESALKWGGNGDGHYIVTVSQAWLDNFSKLSDDYLVQPIINNHRELDKISPCLASVRLVTIKKKCGSIDLFWAGELKTGQEGSINSNTSTGGYNLILSQRGLILKGAYYIGSADEGLVFDEKIDLSGFKVPFYQEATQLCKEAHLSIAHEFFLIAWDVAITEQGPLLIECNLFPGLLQQNIIKEVSYRDQAIESANSYYHQRGNIFLRWQALSFLSGLSSCVFIGAIISA
ncbi:MAG: sugar-transfer associated ATP-grasp domain-containing protein [Oligoflexales bacterium]